MLKEGVGMNYRFENGKHAQLTIDLEVAAAKSEIWKLLATTEGITQWFPELRADNLPEASKLTFKTESVQEEMTLLEYVEGAILSFKWGSGRVSFMLKELESAKTLIHFKEQLPYDFTGLSKDLAGWMMQLERLRTIAEKRAFTFDKDTFRKYIEEIETSLGERVI